MAGEEIPITPEVVQWARERAGFSIGEATKSFKKIVEWEAGESSPTYPQLEKLAIKFKLPIAVFFFPEPPELPSISETFRTLPASEFSQIPRAVRHMLRKAKVLQLNLAELNQGRNPSERLITRDLPFSDGTSVEVMAQQVRDYLGISLREQQRWTGADAALKGWRQALLDAGIFVFKDAFKENSYSGFCLYDEAFPIIYVNNSSAKTRQTFTLFHELAHLLFHTSGIDPISDNYIVSLPNQEQRIEVMCNRFAAEFLVPNDAFEKAIASIAPTEAAAEVLAERYHVSRESIYRKFLDRGLITQAAYTEAAERWASQKKKGSGGNPYWSKITYLGRDYIELALSQYHQNRISDVQLAEYLDTKPKNVGTLEEYFYRGVA